MVVTKVFIRCLVLLIAFASPLAQADAISEIVERGTLRIGIAEFVPWAMPAKRGGHVGYDIDLGVKIAKDMGVRADFKVYEWKDISQSLLFFLVLCFVCVFFFFFFFFVESSTTKTT